MITLLTIGIIIFTVKMICLALKACFGIITVLLAVIMSPVLLFGLLFAGFVKLLIPILIIGFLIMFFMGERTRITGR